MTKSEFKKKVESLRNITIKLNKKRDELFEQLESEGYRLYEDIDIVKFTCADNMSEAINCFIDYNEDDSELLWKELQKHKN